MKKTYENSPEKCTSDGSEREVPLSALGIDPVPRRLPQGVGKGRARPEPSNTASSPARSGVVEDRRGERYRILYILYVYLDSTVML